MKISVDRFALEVAACFHLLHSAVTYYAFLFHFIKNDAFFALVYNTPNFAYLFSKNYLCKDFFR
jgi:hypothetical protein